MSSTGSTATTRSRSRRAESRVAKLRRKPKAARNRGIIQLNCRQLHASGRGLDAVWTRCRAQQTLKSDATTRKVSRSRPPEPTRPVRRRSPKARRCNVRSQPRSPLLEFIEVKSGRTRHGIGGEAQPSQCVWKTRSLGNILQKPEITAIVVELRSWNGHGVERGVRRGQPKVSYTGDRGKNFI